MMAAKIARSSGGVTEGWSRWQIAFAVGTPIAIGAGILYYRSRSRSRQRTTDSKPKDAKKSAEDHQKQQVIVTMLAKLWDIDPLSSRCIIVTCVSQMTVES